MTATPQIIAFLLPGTSRVMVEAPAPGARRKVAELSLHDLPPELVAELLDQRAKIDDRQMRERVIRERDELARRQRVFARTWDRHDLKLAERVVPGMAGKFNPDTGKIVERGQARKRAISRAIGQTAEELGL